MGESAARRGLGKGHPIVHESSLRIDPFATWGKKRKSLDPLAPGVRPTPGAEVAN